MNVLLTGGSRGVGLAIVRRLVTAGERVFVVNRSSSDQLDQLRAEHPGQIEFIAYDFASSSGIKSEVFDKVIGASTPIHGLVNNAAAAYDDLVTNLDPSRLESMFQVNLFSPMVLTKYAIRHMLLHRVAGSIVHISSISVHTGYKGLAMYAATKGALEAFSKNTAREWGTKGIRSNCIVAGFMDTDMSAGLSADQKSRIHQRTSLKQPVEPDSVASSVQFLLSETSGSITGQNLFVDAGTI